MFIFDSSEILQFYVTVWDTRRYKMSDSKPVLTYFEGRGKGEFIRLMLTAAGVDVRKNDTHLNNFTSQKALRFF